jgi:Kef-type K+ transport system membrane component KefB
MDAPHFELPFFTNLLILLVTARFFGEIFERFKQPAMIGEILAGIIVGPSLFNLIHRTEEIKVYFRTRDIFTGHHSRSGNKY